MVVIPMAGVSRRFTNAGYTLPKYMLPLQGSPVFDHAVSSFAALFKSTPFLFVARPVNDTELFLRERCSALGIDTVQIVLLKQETAGQAETVELGLDQAAAPVNEPLTIFNIDTFRAGFRYPTDRWFPESDGYLEVFRGTGLNWSYIGLADDQSEPFVARTTEKQPISDLCCSGLYHFARIYDFRMAFAAERSRPLLSELYVAPLYNHLIAAGRRIHYNLVCDGEIRFCGVPLEYEALLATGGFF